jgi:hypothetical protein
VINVSDDDDLVSAYETAQKDLQGNLKLSITFKPQPPVEEAAVTDKKPKKTKKVSSEDKKKKPAKDTKKKVKKAAATQNEASFSEDQVLRDRAKTID